MNLQQNDYPGWVDEFVCDTADMEEIELPTNQELWNILREHKELPHVGNFYINEMFDALVEHLKVEYERSEFSYNVNAIASSFSVNGTDVTDYDEMSRLIGENEPYDIERYQEEKTDDLNGYELFVSYTKYIDDFNMEDEERDTILKREHSKIFLEK